MGHRPKLALYTAAAAADEGLRTSMLEGLDTGVETSRLAGPRVRLPGYAVLDVADLPHRAH